MPRHYESDTDMFSDSSSEPRSNPYKVVSGSKHDLTREFNRGSVKRDDEKKDKIRREYQKFKKLLSLETSPMSPTRSTTRSMTRSKTRSTTKSAPHSEVVRHFREAFKETSCEGDSDAFKYLLRKAPVPVVLHQLHDLFYVNRDNSANTRILSSYNDKFNVVSRYFLKALKTESRATSAMKSKDDVSRKISKKTPLVRIHNLLHFTPEFILLKTIQAGDVESHDQIVSEWELVDGFRPCRDLIAAFFGVRSFFSDASRYTNRQALVISCICGGSVETLSKIIKDTDTKWLSDFTMRKTREMCTPPGVMLKFLQDSYGLTM